MRTIEQYRRLLAQLSPQGKAWPTEAQYTFAKLLSGLAVEFFRVGSRVEALLAESDPRNALELLEDWEMVVGIPDGCSPPAATIDRRRKDVVARLTQQGALNKQFYVDFAKSLGFDITFKEYRQFQAGRARAGDPITNGLWVFAFQVRAPANTINFFAAGRNQAGDPLANWGNAFLECAINKRKPAETIAIFAYGT